MTMAEELESYPKLRAEGQYHIGAEPLNITFKEIGKRGQRRLDGYEKATGKALYTRDMEIPGMLYARVLRSPYAHAKIKLMDTHRAEALPGVKAILRFDDPEVRGRDLNGSYFAQGWARPKLAGWALKPVHLVLADEAWYEGQPMGAAIAADREAIAHHALSLIHIEWEELPFVLDQEEALKPDAPILRPGAASNEIHDPRKYFEMGDVENGFQTAYQIIA